MFNVSRDIESMPLWSSCPKKGKKKKNIAVIFKMSECAIFQVEK